jgi:hypothetical protein
VLVRYFFEAFENFQGLPRRENFDQLLLVIVGRVLHSLKDNSHYEGEIVLEVLDVLALYMLYNAVHDVEINYLLGRMPLSSLK